MRRWGGGVHFANLLPIFLVLDQLLSNGVCVMKSRRVWDGKGVLNSSPHICSLQRNATGLWKADLHISVPVCLETQTLHLQAFFHFHSEERSLSDG